MHEAEHNERGLLNWKEYGLQLLVPVTSVLYRVCNLLLISCMFCLLDKSQKLDQSSTVT